MDKAEILKRAEAYRELDRIEKLRVGPGYELALPNFSASTERIQCEEEGSNWIEKVAYWTIVPGVSDALERYRRALTRIAEGESTIAETIEQFKGVDGL